MPEGIKLGKEGREPLDSNLFVIGLALDESVKGTGQSGGQTITGGILPGESLILTSTSGSPKGKIYLGANSAYDEANVRLGIGTTAPTQILHVNSTSGDLNLLALSSIAANVSFQLQNSLQTWYVRNNSGGNFNLLTGAGTIVFVALATAPANTLRLEAGGAAFGGAGSFGGGTGCIFITNRTVAPTTNPAGGGILYVEAGALKFKGSSGTVTPVAAA